MTATNRAARLQLLARLDLVTHAIELLRSKEEVLGRERTRLRAHAERTEQDWQRHLTTAATWLLRARALGAGSELAGLHHPKRPATVEVGWQSSMGVTYPGTVRIMPAQPPTLVSTAALAPAAAAHGAALGAAADHAAATTALERVDAELSATRRRRRALEQRLGPQLRDRIHRLDLQLDERDREAALRTRLAARHREATP